MGLGTRAGGLGVARFLAERGAIVTVTDMKPAEDLREPVAQLDGLPIRFVLGRHDERDFTAEGADFVVRNPAVRRTSNLLQLARESGVRVEMEMSLFLRACSAPVIGITGTKGKTTTAALCAEMLSAWHADTVLAGNMGVSAVAELDRIGPETPVVLEISSWQLEALDEHELAPFIAVLTNISEDHLDAYNGFEDYAETKRSITRHQRDTDWFVANADDPFVQIAITSTRARVVPFGTTIAGVDGMQVETDCLVWTWQGSESVIPIPDRAPYLGGHQRLNAAAAASAALLRGAPVDAVAAGIERFGGVTNRMEWVAEIDGVTFINDSAATAPAAAVANLRGLAGRRLHLIAGGFDKGGDLSELAAAIAEHAATIRLLDGSATPRLAEAIAARGRVAGEPCTSMDVAVREAAGVARAGDVVLLSPGCASFGLFRDEFDRGDKFRLAVADLRYAKAAK